MKIEGFKFLRVDRKNREGGGVILYVRENFELKDLVLSDENSESNYIIAEVGIGGEKVLLGLIYRPPMVSHPSTFFDEIERLLPEYKHCILTGDFNAMMTFNTLSNPIYSFIKTKSLHLVPSEPTCHKLPAHTWLDLFIVSSSKNISSYQKSIAPIYEIHDTIVINYKLHVEIPKEDTFYYIREYDKVNRTQFQLDLIQEFEKLPCTENVNDYWNEIVRLMTSTLELHAPLKKIFVKGRRKPGVTQEIRDLMKQRDNIYKQAVNLQSLDLYNTYKLLRNKISNFLDSEKNKYSSSKIDSAKDAKTLWKVLKNIGLLPGNLPSPLSHFEPREINNYLSNICHKHPRATTEDLGAVFDVQLDVAKPIFNFHRTDYDAVFKAFSRVKTRAKGSDQFTIDDISLGSYTLLKGQLKQFLVENGFCRIKLVKSFFLPKTKTQTR